MVKKMRKEYKNLFINLKMTNQIDNSPDPWLMNDEESSGNQIDLSFQDNFTISSSKQESSTELVRLPDSQHYINSLGKSIACL